MLTTSPMISSLRFGIGRNGLAPNWPSGHRPWERHGVLLNPISIVDKDFGRTWVDGVGLFT
jgi:hypothetical protein